MSSTETTSPRRKAGLEARLTDALISDHPSRAAAAVERMGLTATIDFLKGLSVEQLTHLVPLLSPQFAAQAISHLPVERIAQMLDVLALDVGARIARLLAERTDDVIALLDAEVGVALRPLLSFSEQTAGGLMDPRVLALCDDLTAEEALTRVRELSEHARYNLNIVDRQHTLVGVLNLRELLVARPTDRLSNLMVTNPYRLQASASRANIISHPGWHAVHSLPVVDEHDRYLGTLRYRTLRGLEDALRTREENQTSEALGELLAVGAGGLVRSLTGVGSTERD